MLRLNAGSSRRIAAAAALPLISSSLPAAQSQAIAAARTRSCFTAALTANRPIASLRQPLLQAPVRQSASSPFHVHARHFAVSRCRHSHSSGPDPPSPPPLPPSSSKKESRLRKVLPVLAKTRHENINTLPNWLTATRLVAAPFVGYCIMHDHHAWALGLFAYAGITDLLDGWIARRWNLGTVVGTIIDPMADKMLMTVLTVSLAAKGMLPVWLAVIILGRDVALGISAIYYRWISLPPPKTFSRYWDFSLPSAEVRPTTISKYNTALQLGLMGLTTAAPVVPALDLGTPLVVMQCVVAATTVWSGASYVFSKDAVKILPHPRPQQEEEEEGGDKKKEDEPPKN
ncbi:hypothetical protein B0T17DRAFT_508654 [Bombardia bombarda]|uniref:Cardiolipin synthase n=1 Tax=Bombardia bombarda TaxID=252184 RepID=A0AA40C199_9PEZI|nr:hypothetical protein B0T17DRAFT_508654 [Bombardia bombarda]